MAADRKPAAARPVWTVQLVNMGAERKLAELPGASRHFRIRSESAVRCSV